MMGRFLLTFRFTFTWDQSSCLIFLRLVHTTTYFKRSRDRYVIYMYFDLSSTTLSLAGNPQEF